MTFTSSGQLVIGSMTSTGDIIFGSLTSSGFLVLTPGTPSETLNPTIIYFDEDNEMKQIAGTSRIHPVAAYNDSTGAKVNSLTDPTFYVSVNGTDRQPIALTISAFDYQHQLFWLTIPSTLGTITPVDGDEVTITFTDGTASGFAMVQFEDIRPNYSDLTLVGSNVTSIKSITDLLTSDPLAAINAQVDTAISDAATANTVATPTNISTLNAIRILDIIMSGTFTITAGVGGAFTCTYTGRADASTITFTVDANGQRTGTTVTLV